MMLRILKSNDFDLCVENIGNEPIQIQEIHILANEKENIHEIKKLSKYDWIIPGEKIEKLVYTSSIDECLLGITIIYNGPDKKLKTEFWSPQSIVVTSITDLKNKENLKEE